MTAAKSWLVIIVVAAVFAVRLLAQQRTDFAKGLTVEPDEDRPFWELSIPEEVYRTVTRADLGDLRVFNSDGVMVPHVVRRPSAQPGDRVPPQPLPIYALRARPGENSTAPTLQITTDGRGVILGAAPGAQATTDTGRVTAFIVDLAALSTMPESLDLAWRGADDDGFAVTVDVEASNDLARWQDLVTGVTLAELRSVGTMLAHRTIVLPTFRAKSLRIGWPEAIRVVTLTGVTASFPAQTLLPPRQTVLVQGRPVQTAPAGFDFDTGGLRPVDRVRVVLRERNAVTEAKLLSRSGSEGEWRERLRGRFYNLERDGTLLQNEPAITEPISDRYWRLELPGEQPQLAQPPELEIAWVPDLLTVVAQGAGPFTVAFGSATVVSADRTTEGVLSEIKLRESAELISAVRVSAVSMLGGDAKLRPSAPWRTWLLWAVLVGGVGLLALMVRQLVSQSGAKDGQAGTISRERIVPLARGDQVANHHGSSRRGSRLRSCGCAIAVRKRVTG